MELLPIILEKHGRSTEVMSARIPERAMLEPIHLAGGGRAASVASPGGRVDGSCRLRTGLTQQELIAPSPTFFKKAASVFSGIWNSRDEMLAIMVENETTEILIRKAQGGDKEAFAEISVRLDQRLRAIAASRMSLSLRRRLDVDDVVQETLARAFDTVGRFRWTGDGSFLRWLGAIARNVVARAARDLGVSPNLELHPESSGSECSPSRGARREERFERLEEALRQLTQDQREAIRLSRIEGLKIREIAERTGKSPDAVQQLIVRGLRSLRKNFGDTDSLRLPDRALDFGSSAPRDEGGLET